MKRTYTDNISLVIASTYLVASASLWAKDITVSGDLMIDHDSFGSGFIKGNQGSQSISEIRRAQLNFKSTFDNDWSAKIKVSFSADGAEIKDAYVKYQGFDWATITIGQQKESFGLERLFRSRDAIMIERSLVTTALSPERALGVNLAGGNSAYNWHLGYFQPDDDHSTSAITSRAAWLPLRNKHELIHLGVGFSQRDLNNSQFRIDERLEVHTADSVFESETLFAKKQSIQSVEFLWQQSGFTTLAEWQHSSVTGLNNQKHKYQGGYIQLSYQLSGDNRHYKKGVLSSVQTTGWELSSRFSQFELVEEKKSAEIYSLGINYTLNKNIKWMADYIKAKQNSHSNLEKSTSDAISFRLQYSF